MYYSLNTFLKSFPYKDVNNDNPRWLTSNIETFLLLAPVGPNTKDEYILWRDTWKKFNKLLVEAIKKSKSSRNTTSNRFNDHIELRNIARAMYRMRTIMKRISYDQMQIDLISKIIEEPKTTSNLSE